MEEVSVAGLRISIDDVLRRPDIMSAALEKAADERRKGVRPPSSTFIVD
jgi:hypothetical protein